MGFNRCLVLAVTILLIVSCKVRIVVPQGGDVVSQSGALHCASGKTCNIDVVDIFFEEVLVAEPALGYTFKSWKRWPGSKNGFCGGQSMPCALTTAGFDAFPALLAVLGSNQVFHLRPVFQKAAAACTPGTTSYNLALSGAETTQTGSSLKTGDLAFGRVDLTGPIDALIIVDECSTISTAPAAFPPGDPRNTASFNLV